MGDIGIFRHLIFFVLLLMVYSMALLSPAIVRKSGSSGSIVDIAPSHDIDGSLTALLTIGARRDTLEDD